MTKQYFKIAGGMPWTNVFGAQLKWVQATTDSGFPSQWRRPKGLTSTINGEPLSLDTVIEKATQASMSGQLIITIPNTPDGVFKIANRTFWLRDQHVRYLDQYSGKTLQHYTWDDVGILMELRLIAMRLHQGEYGLLNWWIVLCVTLLFTLSTSAGLIAYLLRKPKGRWGLPTVPEGFNVPPKFFLIIIFLGVLFPLFGISLVVLYVTDKLLRWAKAKKQRLSIPS